MAHFTLGEASKQVTASKSTILRALKSGKMSAAKEGDSWRIEASELFRVFDPVPGAARQQAIQAPQEAPDPAEKDAEIARLKVLLEAEMERTEELRADRDRWAAQADKLLQLTVVPTPQKPGLWARLADAIKG